MKIIISKLKYVIFYYKFNEYLQIIINREFDDRESNEQ